MTDWDLSGETHDFYKITRDPEFFKLKNPEIEMVIVVSRGLPTLN